MLIVRLYKGSDEQIDAFGLASRFFARQGAKIQEYFVYFNFLQHRRTKNMPPRRARGFAQRFLDVPLAIPSV